LGAPKAPFALASFALVLGGFAAPVQAQNVLMNSAETINDGNFKLAAFPTVLFGEGGAEDEWGVASRFGYGFTPRFDIEGKLAFFDGLMLYGADAELWLVRGEVDLSASLGLHRKDRSSGRDSTSIDTALLLSGHLTPRLELYGGLNLGFESVDDVSSDFTRAYAVPGIEFRVSKDLDLLAEYGIGLNDDSPNYLSLGLALYLR
jgi:hypothetical protein